MQIILDLAEYLRDLPPPLAVVILSLIPVGELRGSIPVALTVYNMSIPEAIFWSIVGNIIPVYFLLVFFEKGSLWLRQRSPFVDRFLDRLFERTRYKLEDKIKKYGHWALALFVAIPLPITGAWTATLAAFVFGIPKDKAFFSIFMGLMIAASITVIVTLGAVFTINSLFLS